MSVLIDFYRGNATDSEGRFLREMWEWSDDELEEVHDFIQWMFPLTERSRYNPDALLLTSKDIATCRHDEILQENLNRSFKRILEFFGFSVAEDGTIVEASHFSSRVPDVWAYPNHNWLRITRILKSLSLLGLTDEAVSLFQRLNALYSQRRFPITTETFEYWEEAVAADLPE